MTARKEFAQLQRTWYAKLAAEGFHDLERGNGGQLSHRGMPEPDGHADVSLAGKLHWYETRSEQLQAIDSAAHELLHRNAFPNAFHREVWRRHCEGQSIDAICAALGASLRKTLPAYQWCCKAAGVPTAGHRGAKVDKWDKPDKRRCDRPNVLVGKCGLKELLTIAAHVEANANG